jgi:hypothetical protein
MSLVTKDGKTVTITFDIKRFIDSGAIQHVYELSAPPTGLPEDLLPVLQGKRLVLKLAKPAANFDDPEVFDVLLPQTMTRQKQSWNLLNQGGRQVVPHAPFQVFEEEKFMLQEFLEFQKDKLELLPAELRTDPKRFAETMLPAKRRAIAALAKRLGDNELEMMDFNYGNIYLENEGGGWVAKILDPDYIVKYGAPRTAGNAEYFDYIEANSMAKSQAFPSNRPPALLAQMRHLERNGWIDFDMTAGVYRDGLYLKVEDLAGTLPADWPYLPAGPRTPPLISQGQVAEGFARLRAVQANRVDLNQQQ